MSNQRSRYNPLLEDEDSWFPDSDSSQQNKENEMNKQEAETAKNEAEAVEAVDEVAREELRQLRERFEGGKLVPSFSVLFRRALNTVFSWEGWETLGIGCGTSIILVILLFSSVFIGQTCSNHTQDLIERQAQNTRNQYQPACKSLGLEFVSVQRVQILTGDESNVCEGDLCSGIVESVVCAGDNRVVVINARDIEQSTVRHLE